MNRYVYGVIFAAAVVTFGIYHFAQPHKIAETLFEIPGKCASSVMVPTIGRIHISDDIVGAGAFSLVLKGTAVDQVPPFDVAVKIGMSSRAGVDEDTRILSHLNGTESFPIYLGTTHVPCQKGKRIYTHPVVIMELLGESVDTFARASVYKSASYRIKEALIVGRQVLDGLKILHTELGLIMHDLYPRNVVYSRDTLNKTAKLLDFGESSPIYLDGVVMYNYLNRLYTSLREDRREPLGPRDDIERLVYLMVYIVGSGIMPWASDDPDWLVSRKAAMKTSDVCSFLPQEIVEILEYARNGISKAEDLPDYDRIRYLIETALLQLPQNEDADTLNSSRLYR